MKNKQLKKEIILRESIRKIILEEFDNDYELESRKRQYNINPEADEISDEDLEDASEYWDSLIRNADDFEEDGMNDEPMDFIQEKKEDEDEEAEEFEEDGETNDSEENGSFTNLTTEDEKELMTKLQDSIELARKMGDEKLINQLGNTITFFTRTHVARPSEENVLSEIKKLQDRAGIIK
jgi:sugar phosphate isomerase/epimerase